MVVTDDFISLKPISNQLKQKLQNCFYFGTLPDAVETFEELVADGGGTLEEAALGIAPAGLGIPLALEPPVGLGMPPVGLGRLVLEDVAIKWRFYHKLVAILFCHLEAGVEEVVERFVFPHRNKDRVLLQTFC